MCIKFTSWDVLAVLISHQVTGPEPIGSFHYLKKNQFKLQAPEVNLPANSRSLSVSLRVFQPLLLHHDQGRGGEHGRHTLGQHPQRAQWGRTLLQNKVHHVSPVPSTGSLEQSSTLESINLVLRTKFTMWVIHHGP